MPERNAERSRQSAADASRRSALAASAAPHTSSGPTRLWSQAQEVRRQAEEREEAEIAMAIAMSLKDMGSRGADKAYAGGVGGGSGGVGGGAGCGAVGGGGGLAVAGSGRPGIGGPDPNKLRKALCKYWQAGHCQYGAACQFAHGEHQLRSQTTACYQFLKTGRCELGQNCRFDHRRSSHRDGPIT